jgi:hypothetical protein
MIQLACMYCRADQLVEYIIWAATPRLPTIPVASILRDDVTHYLQIITAASRILSDVEPPQGLLGSPTNLCLVGSPMF